LCSLRQLEQSLQTLLFPRDEAPDCGSLEFKIERDSPVHVLGQKLNGGEAVKASGRDTVVQELLEPVW